MLESLSPRAHQRQEASPLPGMAQDRGLMAQPPVLARWPLTMSPIRGAGTLTVFASSRPPSCCLAGVSPLGALPP
jgi:hypothetical protein